MLNQKFILLIKIPFTAISPYYVLYVTLQHKNRTFRYMKVKITMLDSIIKLVFVIICNLKLHSSI